LEWPYCSWEFNMGLNQSLLLYDPLWEEGYERRSRTAYDSSGRKCGECFCQKVKRIGGSALIPFHKKFLGREVIAIVTKEKEIKTKKIIKE